MGWTHIPDMDTTTSSTDDNPFARPKTQPVGKVTVKGPVCVSSQVSSQVVRAVFRPSEDWIWN